MVHQEVLHPTRLTLPARARGAGHLIQAINVHSKRDAKGRVGRHVVTKMKEADPVARADQTGATRADPTGTRFGVFTSMSPPLRRCLLLPVPPASQRAGVPNDVAWSWKEGSHSSVTRNLNGVEGVHTLMDGQHARRHACAMRGCVADCAGQVRACVAVGGCVPLSLVVPPLFTPCYIYGLFTAVLLYIITSQAHLIFPTHTIVHRYTRDDTTGQVEARTHASLYGFSVKSCELCAVRPWPAWCVNLAPRGLYGCSHHTTTKIVQEHTPHTTALTCNNTQHTAHVLYRVSYQSVNIKLSRRRRQRKMLEALVYPRYSTKLKANRLRALVVMCARAQAPRAPHEPRRPGTV